MSAELSSPSPFFVSTYTTARRGRVLPCVALSSRVDRDTWTAHHERAKLLGAFWAPGHGWAFRSDEAAAAFMGEPAPAPEPVKLRVVAPAPIAAPKPAPAKKAERKPREFLPVPPPPPSALKLRAPTWAGNATPTDTINVQVGAHGRYSFTDAATARKFIAAHGGEIVGSTWQDSAAPAKLPKADKRRTLRAKPWAELTQAERRTLCELTPAERATFTAVTPHAAEEQKKNAARLVAMAPVAVEAAKEVTPAS